MTNEKLIEDLKDKFNKEGLKVKITPTDIKKVNMSYEALRIVPVDEPIGVNIDVEKIKEEMVDDSYDDFVSEILRVSLKAFNERPSFDIASLSDYSQMKEKLAMEVVSAEANKDILETVPHQNIEDMAVVYRFVLNDDTSSILVTNQLLESMGVTPEQLHADAMAYAPQNNPVEIKGMSEVMAEMMGVEQAEIMGFYPMAPEDEQMYVATVPNKVHGASVIAYQDFMDKAAERAGGDFFILPSSIHEILIVPDNGKMNLKDLEALVKKVNATQVSPADKLTDSVYHYDSKAYLFELGETFINRKTA